MNLKSQIIIGVDEVGRGAWAGPITAVAVAFHTKPPMELRKYICDSKLLSQAKREKIAQLLCKKYCIYGIFSVSSQEIDKKGIQQANKKVLQQSVSKLIGKLNILKQSNLEKFRILLDGRKICSFQQDYKFIIGGDGKIMEISAASIIAKVHRDCYMTKLHKRFPMHHFNLHKGYGTQKHQEALKLHGISSYHRKSYKPIQKFL